MKHLNKIMNYVLPNCSEVAHLTSRSLDESLPRRKRIALKLHIMVCKFCRRDSEQQHLIRKLISKQLRSAEKGETGINVSLSAESRQRISKAIKSADLNDFPQS